MHFFLSLFFFLTVTYTEALKDRLDKKKKKKKASQKREDSRHITSFSAVVRALTTELLSSGRQQKGQVVPFTAGAGYVP